MTGNNWIQLNEETMVEIVQQYFDKLFKEGIKVISFNRLEDTDDIYEIEFEGENK